MTEAVDPAHHRCIDETQPDEALSEAEHFGARRTRRGYRHRRTGEPEHFAHELGGCVEVVSGGVAKILRQLSAHRIAMLVGHLGRQNARGTGAQKDADPVRAEAAAGVRSGGHEAVLLQRQ